MNTQIHQHYRYDIQQRYQSDAPFRHLVCTLNEVQNELKPNREMMTQAVEASNYLLYGPQPIDHVSEGLCYFHQEDVHLYLIQRNDGREPYDAWVSAVVAATSASAARKIHPSGKSCDDSILKDEWPKEVDVDDSIEAKYIGKAGLMVNPGDVIHNYYKSG